MSENRSLAIPSKGKGEYIEVICVLMALASLGGGAVGAIVLGKTEVISRYGSYTRTEYVPELVTYWLIGGVVSALAWYVLSGIGTLINWHEFQHKAARKTASESADAKDVATPVGDKSKKAQ